MKHKALAVVCGALGIAALVLAAQDVTLKRVAKAGDAASYKMKIDLVVQGTEVNVSFDMHQKVTKVNPDGSYVITDESSNQVVLVGGSEMPGQGDETSTTTYAANGQILKVEAVNGMGDEHRMANLTTIIWPDKPVTVGSKWTAKTAANKDTGAVENSYSFEIQAKETVLGIETFKIAGVVKEVGGDATCTSTTWVNTKTGQTVKSTGNMKNVLIMGMPMDATFVLEMKM